MYNKQPKQMCCFSSEILCFLIFYKSFEFSSFRFLLPLQPPPSPPQTLHGSVPSLLQCPRILLASLTPSALLLLLLVPIFFLFVVLFLAGVPAPTTQRPHRTADLPPSPGPASVWPAGACTWRLRPTVRQPESVEASGQLSDPHSHNLDCAVICKILIFLFFPPKSVM